MQIVCYHVAACAFPAAWPNSEKKLILASSPNPSVHPGGQTQAFELKSCLICFKSFVLLSAKEMLVKILTTDLVIAKLKHLTFDPAEEAIWVG